MRILLDQNVPAGIRRALEKEHRVETTYRLHWEELTNGELLAAAEQGGFDIFITADRNLRYQQNLAHRRIAILVLPVNDWRILKGEVDRIRAAAAGAVLGQYLELALITPRAFRGPRLDLE